MGKGPVSRECERYDDPGRNASGLPRGRASADDGAGSQIQDELGLGDHRAKLALGRPDRRLPHHRRAAAMQRNALAHHRRVHFRCADEFGAGVGRGRALAPRHVHHGADGAQRVGESHAGPAVQDVAGGAEVRPDHHFTDDAFGRELDDANTHQAGKERVQPLLDGFDRVHGLSCGWVAHWIVLSAFQYAGLSEIVLWPVPRITSRVAMPGAKRACSCAVLDRGTTSSRSAARIRVGAVTLGA